MKQLTQHFTPRNLLGHSWFLALLCGFALYALLQVGVPGHIAYAAPNVTVRAANPATIAVSSATAFQQGVVDRTNYYRLLNGCPALVINSKLNTSAQAHADDMATHDFFSHTGSDGSTPQARMQAAGYSASASAENIAAGYSDAASVVDDWFNETPPDDEHRQNILNCKLVDVGVGYTYLAKDTGTFNYNYYWVQDFGTPLAACSTMPLAPALLTPTAKSQIKSGKALLDWNDVPCAQTYSVVINRNTKNGTAVDSKAGLKVSKYKTKALTAGTYYWHVQVCDAAGCQLSNSQMFIVR